MTADLAELKKGLWPYFAALYFKKNILFLHLTSEYTSFTCVKVCCERKKLNHTIRQILPNCLAKQETASSKVSRDRTTR